VEQQQQWWCQGVKALQPIALGVAATLDVEHACGSKGTSWQMHIKG
jgi:hypothetical protein